jgi:hypothetical protein
MGSQDAPSETAVVAASQSPQRKGNRNFNGWPWVALLTAAIAGPQVTECLCALIFACTAAVIVLKWFEQSHQKKSRKGSRNGD